MNETSPPRPEQVVVPAEEADARILERGYRHYEGERGGLGWAMRSVWIQSVQRVLGIRRPARSKVVPVVTGFLAYSVGIAFIGFALIAREQFEEIVGENSLDGLIPEPQYAEYYFFIVLAILLFSAFSGPEILCPDRRTGMLGLYLASPLRRDSYLVAKALAVGAVLMIVTLGPPLLLLLGYTVGGFGPDGPVEWAEIFLRIVAAGIAIAMLHAAIAMAVSSVTTRHALASASFIIIVVMSSIVANTLVENADAPTWVGLFDLFGLPFEFVVRIFGETRAEEDTSMLTDFATWEIAAANIGWTLLFGAFVRQRYQRLDVSK